MRLPIEPSCTAVPRRHARAPAAGARWSKFLPALAAIPALLAGCGDGLSEPPMVTRDAPIEAASAAAEAPGRRAYACFVSTRVSTDPFWYRYRTGTTRFPRSAQVPHGATTVYRYRGHDERGEVVRVVNCEIPSSPRAVEIMDRRLGIERAALPGGSVLMEGEVTLEGLVVKACQYGGEYPYCDPAPIDWGTEPVPEQQECYDWIGCGEQDTGGGGELPCTECLEPDPEPQPEPCNTGHEMIDSPVTQEAFGQVWSQSNYGENVPMADRREHGAWLIKDPSTEAYSYQEFPQEWMAACQINIPAGTVPPMNAVALIHSHPFKYGELLTSCDGISVGVEGTVVHLTYENDTSAADDQTIATLNAEERRRGGSGTIIGIMIDADGIKAFTSATDQVPLPRCGY